MRLPRPIRPGIATLIVLGLVLSLIAFAPSAVRPHPTSAQTCGISQQYCGSYSNYNNYGSGCTGVSSTYCGYTGSGYNGYNGYNGSSYNGYSGSGYYGNTNGSYGNGCTSVAVTCSGYGGSYGTQAYSGSGGPTCVGMVLQAGQTCSNGQVSSCAGQPVYTGATGQPAGASCPLTASSVATNLRSTLPVSTTMTCPGGGFASAGQGCGAATAGSPASLAAGSTGYGTGTAPASAAANPAGVPVSYAAGWNIVSGPGGTTLPGISGTLMTIQAGDSTYENISAGTPLKAGAGYWVYLSQTTQSSLPVSTGGSVNVILPAGQFVLIGNPGNTVANVSGADTVLVFDPASGNYSNSSQLKPGQGAWAMSNAGGQATITTT